MSTIDPTRVDPTKPETGDASTATERAQRQVLQDELGNAKTDIEALEAGKEDSGTAAAAVAAHDASGAAHGGVEAAFSAHQGAGGAEHADATTGAAGFMSAADKTKLDGLSPGGSGTYNEAEKDSVSQSVGRAKIDFRDTGDATVTVTDDPANDRTIVSIDATAGAGGGGVGKGTPFVVGDVTEVESSAGDGSIRSTGISTSSLSGHLGDGTIHFTQASIDHTAIQNVGTNSHAQIDTHIGDGSVHFTEASITHNNVGGRTTADAHPTSAITGLDAALAAKLENVIEDTTPQLGGNLETKGNAVIVTRADDVEVGRLLNLTSPDLVALARTSVGNYDPNDGAIAFGDSFSEIHGTRINVPILKHANDAGRQVYCNDSGDLYAIDPPAPSYSQTETDDGDYSLGSGDTPGAAVNITGLGFNPSVQLEIGDTITVTVTAWVQLGKDGDPTDLFDKSSSIELGFGINGVHDGTWYDKRTLGPYFAGNITQSLTIPLATQILVTDTINVFYRRGTGEDSSCNPWIYGTGEPGVSHRVYISRPAAGGGGGGDVLQGVVGNDGDLTGWDNATGKVLGSVGFAATDVARKSQSQTFTGNEQIVEGASASKWIARVTGGTADKRRIALAAGAALVSLVAENDDGTARAALFTMLTNDNIAIGSQSFPLSLESSEAIKRNGSTSLMLESQQAATIGAVGFAATTKTQASGGNFKPEPLDRNFVEFTGSTATTLDAMTEDGAVTIAVPDGLSVNLAAYTEIGSQQSGRVGYLECRKLGTTLTAAWV